MASQKTYKLVTVNNAPERAKRLVGRVIEDLKDHYSIVHAGNAESTFVSIDGAQEQPAYILRRPRSSEVSARRQRAGRGGKFWQPTLHIFTASMWSPEQSSQVFEAARKVNPNVKTLAIPQGLQVEKGPDAVVEFIKEQLPVLLKA
ncbi:hypothetical protein LTR27_007399 [Elasticomyces elasticus]|nr:hypothetical protein LTR27_007399 [Elasticomyces elasticus]